MNKIILNLRLNKIILFTLLNFNSKLRTAVLMLNASPQFKFELFVQSLTKKCYRVIAALLIGN